MTAFKHRGVTSPALMFAKLKSVQRDLKHRLNTYRLVVKDSRTPTLAKILLGIAVGYALLPFDLIPDFIPIIGHLDDVIIVPGLIIVALKIIPPEVIEDCKNRAGEVNRAAILSLDNAQEIDHIVRELAKRLPRFPDGRIDYSHSDKALVVTCFVKFADKILLLQRSDMVRTYPGKWNTVAGYIDQPKPLRELALRELSEELGISAEDIADIKTGIPFEFHDPEIAKTWRVHPVVAELRRIPEIKMDWEHTDYRWILPGEIHRFDIVPKLEDSLKRVLSF